MSVCGKWSAIAMALCCSPAAHAVNLDAGGRGQVLIYPYYTVNGHQQTLLSVTNTSSSAQALRLRFREGYNGREVLDFNLWLSPYDVWTATVFALADAGLAGPGAALFTTDSSCISPAITTTSGMVNGRPVLPFTDTQFVSRNADGGPTDLARTREGWIEIIAMADAIGALGAAVTHTGATQRPANCAAVQSVAATHPSLQGRPRGQLMGTVSIINVAQGTLLATRAEALSGFTGVSLFAEPGSLLPNLGSVNDGVPGQKATAHVNDSNGRLQSLSYGAPASNGSPASRPVDAVSAVLMAQRIVNEYSVNPAIGASSDWVLTFPTKNLYTDPRWIGTDYSLIAPFQAPFGPPGLSELFLGIRPWDRQGSVAYPYKCLPIQPCYDLAAVYAVNVLPFTEAFADETDVLHSRLPLHPVRPDFPLLYLEAAEGWAEVKPANYSGLYSIEGKRMDGVPVIGFWATNLINNQVSDGVLSNYGAALRHSTSVDCSVQTPTGWLDYCG